MKMLLTKCGRVIHVVQYAFTYIEEEVIAVVEMLLENLFLTMTVIAETLPMV
jgi:hypothetical protein